MKHSLILFITIWTSTIIGSGNSDPLLGKNFIVCNEEFYTMKEEEAVKKNTTNPYYFQKILENIYFDFSFVSSTNDIYDYITVSAKDVTKLPEYQSEIYDKLVTNMIQIKNKTVYFYFKEKFSKIEFQLLKCYLSYAYENNKKLVVDQNLSSYLATLAIQKIHMATQNLGTSSELTEERIKIANAGLTEKTVGMVNLNPIIENFKHVGDPQSNDIIIPIYVILNTKNVESLRNTWNLISTQDSIPFINEETDNITQDVEEIVKVFNNEYKKFIVKFKIELAELNQGNKPNEDKSFLMTPFMMQYGPTALNYTMQYGPTALDYTLRYGLPAIQAYTAYSTIQSGYQSVGSLRGFLKIPPTKTGKAKALINIYSVYSSFLMLYGYTKSGLNWLKGKIYGNKDQEK